MSNTEELDRTLERAERLIPLLGSNNQTGTSTITVNAGGIGVWLAMTCCAVATTLCLVMVLMYVDTNRKYDRMQDLLSVIYQQAPWLKEPPQK